MPTAEAITVRLTLASVRSIRSVIPIGRPDVSTVCTCVCPPGIDKPLPPEHTYVGKGLSSRIGARLLEQSFLWRLPSAAMTDFEDLEARRRGYWLRRARDNVGVTLADAAVTAGLAAGSGSTVSLWERGQRPIKVIQLTRLARRYGVPVTLFTNPPMTDDERLALAIVDAQALERADWESGEATRQQGDDAPGGSPRRRLQ